jgi:hypothetical protein
MAWDVFISHSSADKAFVRVLSASLQAVGCTYFLDDHEIAIGDSIPDKVFAGIEKSSSLIVVVSEAAMRSGWVAAEIDSAVMKRVGPAQLKIFPVVIEDDVELPSAIRHLKYGDFRKWTDPSNYRRGIVVLLNALGLEAGMPAEGTVRWYADNLTALHRAEQVVHLGEQLRACFAPGVDYESDLFKASALIRIALKNYLWPDMSDLIDAIEKGPTDERLTALGKSLLETRDLFPDRPTVAKSDEDVPADFCAEEFSRFYTRSDLDEDVAGYMRDFPGDDRHTVARRNRLIAAARLADYERRLRALDAWKRYQRTRWRHDQIMLLFEGLLKCGAMLTELRQLTEMAVFASVAPN